MDDARQFHAIRRTLIIEDHPLFSDALSMTLKMVVGVESVVIAPDLGAALDRLESGEEVDAIMLDLNLPDVTGLDGLIRLRAVAGSTPVVVVSSLSDPAVVKAAMRAGASGFVPKHSARAVFHAAFQAIGRGERFLPEGLSPDDDAPAERTRKDDAIERLGQLTRQQMKILALICDGKLNKQIAYDLSIAEATVKAHVTAIMRKLGVQSRTQAVLIAKEASFEKVLQSR